MRTVADLLDASRGTGCRLVGTTYEAGQLVGHFDFSDPWAAARLLLNLARIDAREPAIRKIAARLARAPDPAEAIHTYVQTRARFAHEKGEDFQSPLVTLGITAPPDRAVGDCDCHFLAVAALAHAAGVPCEARFLVEDGEPSHVWAALEDAGGTLRNAETTVRADFGEHPIAAAERLRVARPDLRAAGEVHAIGAVSGADQPESFFLAVERMAARLGMHPEHLLRVWWAESRLIPSSRNSIGAAGLNGLLPSTMRALGMTPDEIENYPALSAEEQLPTIEKDVRSRIAMNGGRAFASAVEYWHANIAPASLGSFLLFREGSAAYNANRGLDRDGDGVVDEDDLAAALDAAASEPGYRAILARYGAAVVDGGWFDALGAAAGAAVVVALGAWAVHAARST